MKGYEQQGESCQIRIHHYVAKDLNRLTLSYKVRRIRSNEIILQFRENWKLSNKRKPSFSPFVTYTLSDSYRWAYKRASFTLQKGTFYTSKGHLLPCKRASFGIQKMPFQKSIGNLSYKRVVLTVMQSPVNYSFSMYELFPRCVSLYI